jgi:hypothetical protein
MHDKDKHKRAQKCSYLVSTDMIKFLKKLTVIGAREKKP